MEGSFLNYVMAGYPFLWVQSHEESRVLSEFVASMAKAKEAYKTFAWDVAEGVRQIAIKDGILGTEKSVEKTENDPMAPLLWLDENAEDNTILFLKDYHPFLEKSFDGSVLLTRKIRNLIAKFKSQGKVLVILSPGINIPMELDKEITVMNFRLPEKKDLRIVLKSVCESGKAKYPSDDEAVLNAALGMTSFEAENALSVSLIESRKFDSNVVRREKASIVKKGKVLEVVDSTYTLEDIGGLENLKTWLKARKDCFTPKAIEFGLKSPKGLLLIGVPGCGKSLSAKAVASAWERPLLRLDMGKVFGSYVGESEDNMRRCLDIAEAVAPCILWIDELEKSFAGNKAGSEGHETTRRVFQEFLTWLQDKKKDVFIMATANSVESLPPEFLRAGRIDATFWVDLPDAVQRAEIFRIHLKKTGRKADMFDDVMPEIVKACDTFSGAEIEVWIQEALTLAFSSKLDNITKEALVTSAKEITPISKLMKNDIDKARAWAINRGTKNASICHTVDEVSTTHKRKVSLEGQQGE